MLCKKILDESNSKPKEIWVDKDSEFSTHNEGKSVVAERIIRTLRKKTYKYMISISKNVHIDKSDEIVNNCY